MSFSSRCNGVGKSGTLFTLLMFLLPWLAACGNFEAQQAKVLAAEAAPGKVQNKPMVIEATATSESLVASDLAVQGTETVGSIETPTRPALAGDLPPIDAKVGFLAPEFTMQTLDGKTIRLSDLRGRPVLINYWVSWCIPCKEEMPILEKIHQDYQQKGLQVVSVDAIEQDNLDDVKAMVNTFQMSFPVMLDQGEAFKNTYQASFFPTNYFIDANGIIREIILGNTTAGKLTAKVEWLMAGKY
jgi:cytochrome c biogenesis protein CcmG/thiol:disulfide interchange protein DsbE